MEPLGVHVSVIEPGNYDSAISASARSRILAMIDGYQKEGSPFAEEFREWTSSAWDRSRYKQPDEVSEAALHAMFDEQPLRRYMVVPNAHEAGLTLGKQIEELVQLNEWHAYKYSRDELVEMLDAALAQ
jgi:NAD(P)-dependent dehydrogenase (short-subunit alcohol dehydrogenase family)